MRAFGYGLLKSLPHTTPAMKRKKEPPDDPSEDEDTERASSSTANLISALDGSSRNSPRHSEASGRAPWTATEPDFSAAPPADS